MEKGFILYYGIKQIGGRRQAAPGDQKSQLTLTTPANAGRASIRGPRVRAIRSARAVATAIHPDE